MRLSARRRFAEQSKALFLAGVPITLPHEAFDAAYAFACAIHDQVVGNDLVGGIRHFVDRGDSAWRLLTAGFGDMTGRERALALTEVWKTTRASVATAVALPLFQDAAALRRTLPGTLELRPTLFRGVAAETEAAARQALNGLSWTLDRVVAGRYAHGHLDWRRREGQPPGLPWIGRAEVDRADVLAWFGHRDENEIIVAPSSLLSVSLEPHLD